MEKVVLGLSGGVDSALCARLLLEKGHPVTGVYLDTGHGGVEEAHKAALELGIPFCSVDVREQLEEKVIAPFMEGYRRGITPIPCIFCNPAVKFHVLWQKAQELGASYVATGHYAVTRRLENGVTGLYMSPSPNDQSYMLYRLLPELLDHVLFPLGELCSKEDTRTLARKAGLSAANKPDSMEICFIPEGDHAAFMEQRGLGLPPGDFVDEAGNVLGKHKGIHHYTLGQRRGLGIAAEGRLFVKEIRTEQNQVVLSLTPPTSQVITVDKSAPHGAGIRGRVLLGRCEDPPQPPSGQSPRHLSAGRTGQSGIFLPGAGSLPRSVGGFLPGWPGHRRRVY